MEERDIAHEIKMQYLSRAHNTGSGKRIISICLAQKQKRDRLYLHSPDFKRGRFRDLLFLPSCAKGVFFESRV